MTDWDRRYRAGEHHDEPPDPLVTAFAAQVTSGKALDVACGSGRHALWLAENGWDVQAVDSSSAGLEILNQHAHHKGLQIRAVCADLERGGFEIESDHYDLIVVCKYLQRNLFPAIREGVRVGGVVIVVIAMVDANPDIPAMNPAYLLHPGELRAEFAGWELLHDTESKPDDHPGRAFARIVARR